MQYWHAVADENIKGTIVWFFWVYLNKFKKRGRQDLETYCHSENLYFPIPRFIKSLNTGHIYCAVDLVDDKLFVFPPRCEIVFYQHDNHIKAVYFDELMSVLEKFCHDLPGFIHNTKVLDKAGMKRLKKIMLKTKFSPINETFSNVELETIIDFK